MHFLISTLLVATPGLVFAQGRGIKSSIFKVIGILNEVVAIAIGFALLGFVWGVFKYLFQKGDPSKIAEARSFMIYGIIALFVMISVWGLIEMVQELFGFQNGWLPGTR